MITPQLITDAAISLIDVPFKHQGRDEDFGLDCAGVLVAAFRKLGIALQELPIDYRPKPAESHLRACLDLNFLPSPSDVPQPGDILHLKFNRDTQARHLGIIVPVPAFRDLYLVHALRSNRAVILENLPAVLKQASIAGIFQWPPLQS